MPRLKIRVRLKINSQNFVSEATSVDNELISYYLGTAKLSGFQNSYLFP